MVTIWKPDLTFYPSPRMAMQAPSEELAYVVVLNTNGRPDALAVMDVDPESLTYLEVVGRVEMPNTGDELHHFGWNACSAALCPYAPHPHMERRYLLVPGLKSSRIYVIDTKHDPTRPKIVKVIEADELHERTCYSRPHTFHCGPDGIYVSALGAPDGNGPGGVFVMDHETFEPLGRWEVDRGSQQLAYDFWWHLGHDTMISSEWGPPTWWRTGSTRRSSSQTATATGCTPGTSGAASTCRRWISARSTRWCWSFVPPTTPRRRTASLASSSPPRTSPPRSGCGTARTAGGPSRRS